MRVFSICCWFLVLLEGYTARSIPGKWCQCGHVRSSRGGHSARPRITKLHPRPPKGGGACSVTVTVIVALALAGGSPFPCQPALPCLAMPCPDRCGLACLEARDLARAACMLACLHGGTEVECVQRRGNTLRRGCGKARQDLSRARVVSYRGSSTVCAQGCAYFATRICSRCNGATTRGRRLRRVWRGQIWSLF